MLGNGQIEIGQGATLVTAPKRSDVLSNRLFDYHDPQSDPEGKKKSTYGKWYLVVAFLGVPAGFTGEWQILGLSVSTLAITYFLDWILKSARCDDQDV